MRDHVHLVKLYGDKSTLLEEGILSKSELNRSMPIKLFPLFP